MGGEGVCPIDKGKHAFATSGNHTGAKLVSTSSHASAIETGNSIELVLCYLMLYVTAPCDTTAPPQIALLRFDEAMG